MDSSGPLDTTGPQPPGAPRWVAQFHDPATGGWRIGAESPYRAPVAYAIGEMAQTLRARGEEVAVTLWGPDAPDGWRRHDSPLTPPPASPASTAAPRSQGPTRLTERMTDRRQQVLLAGLGKAGVYELTDGDEAAVQRIVDTLDETTVRTLARWLAHGGTE
ncbi:hypothetical protein AB0D49_37250 [Streptomyces sp. NPDC048290]|uniref:hypothetical protein n=1 Tax=Streptomyces sp. NPDC048290 TaxID=3155811 RepID=UPI00343216F8